MTEKINTPESSNMTSFSYDGKSKVMQVTFKSGQTYTYRDVPPHLFSGMKSAPSRGSYFAKHIKGKFGGEIEEDFLP